MERGFPETISAKFYTKLKGWLKYKIAKNIAECFNPLSRTHDTNVTDVRQTSDDRRICDRKDPNVT